MPSLDFRLHPLVLISVSDHYTRCVLQAAAFVRADGRAQLQSAAGVGRAATRAGLPAGHALRACC